MTLRKALLAMIGMSGSWIGTSSADAQVFFARGIQAVAVVNFDTEPKTAASVQMHQELLYLETANRLFAARQQFATNQMAAYQFIEAQRKWQAQQFSQRNKRPTQRFMTKKSPKKP